MIRHNDRHAVSHALTSAKRAVNQARAIFDTLDNWLLSLGEKPVLSENRAHIDSQFNQINQCFREILVTMAEDKKGKVRNNGG